MSDPDRLLSEVSPREHVISPLCRRYKSRREKGINRMMGNEIRVVVWNEFVHEKEKSAVAAIYPGGIHGAIADGMQGEGFSVRTAILDEPEHGLTDEVLAGTDVLLWWGHAAHDRVSDLVVNRVYKRVLDGMGLIVLHSGHFSKIFKKLMGTECGLIWREAGEKERLWVTDPSHPIAEGLADYL